MGCAIMVGTVEINVLLEDSLEGCLEVGWVKRVAEKVLALQGVESGTELGLVIVGEERIRQLNLSYLGKDEPTDVLAFAMLPQPPQGDLAPFVAPPDGVKHLGEVIVSYPQAVIQAGEHQHPVAREIAILITHGILHLLGYEHDEPELEGRMRAREAEILSHIEGGLD